MTTLRTLIDILSAAVGKIEDQYAAAGLELPSLNDPFDMSKPGDAMLFSPDVARQASVVVAAAEQLSVTVRPPQFVLLESTLSFHKTACVSAVNAGNVAEILREAGPQGLHVKDISARNGLDSGRMARILRLLATHHIFTEVSPDVFTNNRVSSVLDTGKPVSELSTPPQADKYTGTNGMAAMASHMGDEALKCSSYMTEFLTTPPKSQNEVDSPFNRAFDEPDFFAEWLSKPGNESRAAILHVAMQGTDDRGAILNGFPWGTLPAGSKVVDVAGGLGSVSLTVAKAFPKLKFVIQDVPKLVPQAEKFWNDAVPGILASGRVIIQGHDFFTPQPIQDADLFMLRFVIHDWADREAIKILKNLRAAATPGKTKLLIVDNIVSYACPGTIEDNVEGLVVPTAPEPLLANFGRASAFTYLADMQMLIAQDAQERTIGDHLRVMKESGWKIVHVYSPPGSTLQHILAEPI